MTGNTTIQELSSKLRDNGISASETDIASLLAGVSAAPNESRDDWIGLLAPTARISKAVAADLTALADRYIADLSDGLDQSPAPPERLDLLRAEMRRLGLSGLVIPRTDEYQGEYIARRAERVQWLTGFSGSAGVVVVGLEKAAVFVDGRYTLQVRDQVDTVRFEPRHLIEQPVTDWIADQFTSGDKVGYDPWLHTLHGAGHLNRAASRAGAELVRVAPNPVDAIWPDQPAAPVSAIHPHGEEFAGRSSAQKRREIADKLSEQGADALAVTATDSIAWLINVRGGDVPNCPLPLSFAILHEDGSLNWFVDDRKLTAATRAALGNSIAIHPEEKFAEALTRLGQDGKTVMADPASAPSAIFDALHYGGGKVIEAADPCLLPKACKNPVEIDGTRAAHRRDGAALTRFLKWLPAAADDGLTELDAIAHLRGLRDGGEHFRGASFDTIAGAGPNGAVIHYRASEATNRKIEDGQLVLVDSGGQYLDGTTDVTRTIAVGEPTDEMRTRYTLVLKGHIAIATARFPRGVTGSQLDPLARLPLWQAGLDFDHGTGHGVGSYLNVHEGPQRIAKAHNAVALEPGMILSNEPGYYKTGEYGIRIENLVVVRAVEDRPEGAEKDMLEFETLTLAPYDRKLIDKSLLTKDEIAWVDSYHKRVRETLKPLVDKDTAKWLADVTKKL